MDWEIENWKSKSRCTSKNNTESNSGCDVSIVSEVARKKPPAPPIVSLQDWKTEKKKKSNFTSKNSTESNSSCEISIISEVPRKKPKVLEISDSDMDISDSDMDISVISEVPKEKTNLSGKNSSNLQSAHKQIITTYETISTSYEIQTSKVGKPSDEPNVPYPKRNNQNKSTYLKNLAQQFQSQRSDTDLVQGCGTDFVPLKKNKSYVENLHNLRSDHFCKIEWKNCVTDQVICKGCRYYKFEYEPQKCRIYKAGQRVKISYKMDINKSELSFLLSKKSLGMNVVCNSPDVKDFSLFGPPRSFYGQDIACEFTMR